LVRNGSHRGKHPDNDEVVLLLVEGVSRIGASRRTISSKKKA